MKGCVVINKESNEYKYYSRRTDEELKEELNRLCEITLSIQDIKYYTELYLIIKDMQKEREPGKT